MKRLITTLVMGVFPVGMLCSSAAALKEDPNAPRPWMERTGPRPNGDEGGWHEADSIGPERSPLIIEVVSGLIFRVLGCRTLDGTGSVMIMESDKSGGYTGNSVKSIGTAPKEEVRGSSR